MNLHDDYSQRIVLNHNDLPWVPSPEAGVQRRMLDRRGDEVARATSIVRYEPGAKFAAHTHDLGEEIFVVEGVFEDEHGRYPQGSWIRSPHMSQHQPFIREGCTILVKTGHLLA